MTSVLPEAESKVTRMKQKLMNDLRGKEEARSFLSFSRENLSISDIEQGFNKYRFRPWRNTILTLLALSLSLVCLGVETWRFHYTTINSREIEDLKRNVESLKHRLLKEDLLDELKSFEEQLYAESSDDDDPDIDNADYDSNYDQENFSPHDYSSDYQDVPKYGAKPSDFPDSSSTIVPVPTPPELSTNKAIVDELLATVRKVEAKHESKKTHRFADRQEKEHGRNEHKNNTEISTVSKSKRSIEESYGSKRVNNRRQAKNKMRRILDTSFPSWEDRSDPEGQNTSIRIYPPKKYTHSTKRANDSVNSNEKLNLRSMVGSRTKRVPEKLHHTQETVAFHFHGNYGSNRIHTNSVFKAWKPSDWVSEFNMSKHFVLAEDGKVTVKTAGLYLVYGQIHYYDNSRELGFHIALNGEPVLLCMIENPDGEHISQTCYSAQVIPLRRNDVLVVKEVASTKSVIFDRVNSFFGLVRLGKLPKRDD